MNTFMEKKETVERKWYVIDAEGVSLGRLATKVATILRGKHKPTYTPQSGPAYTNNFVYICLPNLPLGNIPLTALSTISSGYFSIISPAVLSLNPPAYLLWS